MTIPCFSGGCQQLRGRREASCRAVQDSDEQTYNTRQGKTTRTGVLRSLLEQVSIYGVRLYVSEYTPLGTSGESRSWSGSRVREAIGSKSTGTRTHQYMGQDASLQPSPSPPFPRFQPKPEGPSHHCAFSVVRDVRDREISYAGDKRPR